jgi:hypothetical protein
MFERDDNTPPLPELLVELEQARDIAAAASGHRGDGVSDSNPITMFQGIRKHDSVLLHGARRTTHPHGRARTGGAVDD